MISTVRAARTCGVTVSERALGPERALVSLQAPESRQQEQEQEQEQALPPEPLWQAPQRSPFQYFRIL
ncbi:MAG: hypothetical protein K2X41_07545 [Hyphomicrobium sp.]|nr:hypothetical protein [Hyphomicrobium sp.]